MPGRVVWNIAAPMIGLGAFLLGLGVVAAWNVHKQQQTSSELVIREVHGMLAIDELHMAMREIRYQVNIFLRTKDPQHLARIPALHEEADKLLRRAKGFARTEREQELIGIVEVGYRAFFVEFQLLAAQLPSGPSEAAGPAGKSGRPARIEITPEQAADLTRLTDDVLTNSVLQPLRECLAVNQQVVERTNEASQATAQHLKIGFLLLGVCGGAAGLLLGTAIARAIGRSIVQLNVSVRGVVDRLADVKGPVMFSHTGDLAGIEAGMRTLEGDIADVVERLQQRETELLRAEQLARVGQLAAGLAHELRNPLMPMKMLVQAAIERGDEGGLKGRSLQVLNDEIGRLEGSIQAFLDFARPPVPEKTTVDIKEIIGGTLDLVAARARQQVVQIRSFLPEGAVLTRVDQTQIRQLLLNLLLNALDTLPDGGLIEVALDPSAAAPASDPAPLAPQIEKVWRQGAVITEHDALRLFYAVPRSETTPASKWLAIRVADSGPGIPAQLLASIFEPFVTTKETGTGLGLSICQRIAAAHGGTLSVRNRYVSGAEFTLLLPYDA
jgi:two-component system sensor histidine kinase HydH